MLLNRKQYLCYTWCHRKYFAYFSRRHIHQSCVLHLRKPSAARKTTSYLPNTSNMTDSGLFPTQKAVSYGNTNFYGIEGDEGVIYADEIPKHHQLIQDSVKNLQRKPKSEFKTVSFGAVRLDLENRPTYYARYSIAKDHLESSNPESESYTSEFVSSETPNVDNLNDIIENNSCTERNQSFFLSDSEENYSVNHVFPESEELKRETNLSNSIKSSSPTKLNSSDTFEKNQADLYATEKNNFIDSCYFPNLNNKENAIKNVESDFKTNNVFSKSDFDKTFQNENMQNTINSDKETPNYIDEQYFPDAIVKDLPAKSYQKDYNYIDEQYFSDVDSVDTTIKNNTANSIKNASNDLNLKCNITSQVDEQDFTQKNAENLTKQILSDKVYENKKHTFIKSQQLKDNDVINKSKIEIHKKEPGSWPVEKNTTKISSPSSEKRNKSVNYLNKKSSFEAESHSTTSTSKVETETAYDFVKQLREKQTMSDEIKRGISAKKEKKVDSKGFRILKHQVPSLIYFTRDEMLELLKKNILYIDEDIVILNKPYNLTIHESNSTKNNTCLSTYLSDFAQIIGEKDKSPDLFTIHRLDKETTGCLLLARNKETAQRMKSLFAQRKIIKTYWIVTSKVPDPMEGVIDIPISEGKIGERSRMVLHPDLPSDTPYVNHSKCGKRAVTYYSVIATSGNAALVEVKPETGIKHQIRVHFGFGLACPILGDHKYSYLDKFVPQKLPSDLLQKLRVRQSKVRHIPLHIHSKHLLIPQYSNQQNLYVTAPLPHHMSENLRFLKFKKK